MRERIATIDRERIATTEVRRQMVGDVGIDLLAGPNEALVLADETADRNSSRPTSWRRQNTIPLRTLSPKHGQ